MRADIRKLLAETYNPLIEWLTQPSEEDPWVGIHLIVVNDHSSPPTIDPERHDNGMEGDSDSMWVELGSAGEC